MSDQIKLDWKVIRQKAGPYPQEAFQFVREGLQHTVKTIYGADTTKTPDRHVNGQQLCVGLRDFAVLRYGLLARLVLTRWGITRTDDFGKIVFAMIDAGFMRKSDEDNFEHFQAVYDFDEAFATAELV